ncbi:MAG: PHP domain-containing protein, partial [Hyphomicrobiales bacterium]
MVNDAEFIHLRCHSAYSLLEGGMKIPQLISLTKKHNMPALGLVDTCNLFGALEFSEKAASEGIQPIIGCQLKLSDITNTDDNETRFSNTNNQSFSNIVLIAMNDEGYKNLVALVSRSYMDTNGEQEAHITPDMLRDLNQGIICLSGGRGGPID